MKQSAFIPQLLKKEWNQQPNKVCTFENETYSKYIVFKLVHKQN